MQKTWAVIKGIARRKWQMLHLQKYDYVFIHREAAPLGPPFFEWWIAKVAGKKIIYDFDDAIWLPNTSDENRMVAKLKWHTKTASICKWVWKVSCGNEFLAGYAKKYNSNVVIIPTTIDLNYHTAKQDEVGNKTRNEIVKIGWTGSHSTIKYLDSLRNVIVQLVKTYQLEFIVISIHSPQWNIESLKFIEWNKETEIADLQTIDIGVMPLEVDDWAKGKCGFKALQFMALGKPVVASPVGANTQIIHDGVNGFLASSEKEWVKKLSLLIKNPELRRKLGKEGRKTVIEQYSVEANNDKYLQLFQN